MALSTDPDDGASQPTDANLNGIADSFEVSQSGSGGNSGGAGSTLPGMPEGDILYSDWFIGRNNWEFNSNNLEELSRLEAIKSYRVIDGSLIIRYCGLTEIDLPNLEEIRGELIIESCDSLYNLNMSLLSQVGSQVYSFGNNSYRFTEITLPNS